MPSPFVLLLLRLPLPPLPLASLQFERAPGRDRLMPLRCGNQILKSLPLAFLPCLSPKPTASISQPAHPTSCFPKEFNSARGDSVIDRLREREKIWFKPFFFHNAPLTSNLFFSLSRCALGFAIDSLVKTQPPSSFCFSSSLFSSSLHTFPTPLNPGQPQLPDQM